MANLSTTYMGLNLGSPIIASSSGLTSTPENLKNIAQNGAGAIVLKSLFEEEIVVEMEHSLKKMYSENHLFPETIDFVEDLDVEDTLSSYLRLIAEGKKQIQIPIIASINCVTPYNWPYFAKSLQDAGADGIELNISVHPTQSEQQPDAIEENILTIIRSVRECVSIPVAVKISPYFANLSTLLQKLSGTGIEGIVLFNRFYSPDIDIDKLEVIPSHILSEPQDYTMPLQWIGWMSGKVSCDMAASTGVHHYQSLVKMILAGASAVQVASILYKNGFQAISQMNQQLNYWMDSRGFATIGDFKGRLSQTKVSNPAGYNRLQFMKHFAGK